MRNSVAGIRPISYPRVSRAIGQSRDAHVTAEAEILRARVTYGPAAMPLLELQRAGIRPRAGYLNQATRLRLCPQRSQNRLLCHLGRASFN
jgi:hypothetical protein